MTYSEKTIPQINNCRFNLDIFISPLGHILYYTSRKILQHILNVVLGGDIRY